MFREGLRVYPLADAQDPPKMEFVPGSGLTFNTIHANDVGIYEELHAVIDREHDGIVDPETRGREHRIRKGQPFAPDERMTGILRDAAAVANATARSLAFQPRDPGHSSMRKVSGRPGLLEGTTAGLFDDGAGGRNLDARTYFFYIATNTRATALRIPGVGSQYAVAARDRSVRVSLLLGCKRKRVSLDNRRARGRAVQPQRPNLRWIHLVDRVQPP